ncbi:ATP-grasp domain-containing protein [Streptomyces sp. CA-111067]|uniref:ATP-grasp domain-containing protein n=1 Tax=Streptomyces sp. CA-111067 TaxID=3240046 RepID=UPI003D96D688
METALLAAGHTVTLLTPASGPAHPPPGIRAVHTIGHWDDLDALTALEPSLPPVGAVATIDEQCIVAAAHLRQLRGLPGLRVDAAHRYTDKHAMKNALDAAGLPVAAHRLVHHADEIPAAAQALGWPVIVKPRAGAATWNTFVVRSEAHLKELVAAGAFDARVPDITGRFHAGHALDSLHEAADGFLVEAFLDLADEYFVDLYVHEGEVLLAAPGRYDQPLLRTVGSASYDTVLPPDHPEARAVTDLARRAAAALGAQTGAVHCEILRTTDGRLHVGEAAARPGGDCITELTGLMFGIDVPTALAALAVGERPALPTEPHYPALTAVMIAAPPGTVTRVATAETIAQRPGVMSATINLRPGEPVPATAGTVTGAGRILYHPHDHTRLDREVAELRAALDIQVTPAPAAAASEH